MGRILVVDDFQPNRELLKRRLVQQGHVVEEALDGEEALQLMRQNPPDLVLLDILMPRKSGYDVLQEKKEDPSIKTIPVIIITGVEQTESFIKCLELGADDYMTKPFNALVLKARINACLEKKMLHDNEQLHLKQIEQEKRRVDELLQVIFPPQVLEELKRTDHIAPRLYENVAILFCDVVDFTAYCNQHSPQEILNALQELVEHFERVALKHHVQKIKTNGDAFIGTAGLLDSSAHPVHDCVRCGLEMAELSPRVGAKWEVRVGIHFGSALAGIVGHRSYSFDVWGSTVNIASSLSEQGSISGVTITHAAKEQIEDSFETISVGKFPIRGIGPAELFRVIGPKK